ncbi:hypothetical protein QTN93_01730 [Sphingomonas aerolata]|uniref:hypothetical protein n=1 Tax=Sphingomonas aerolata TaxID=185951 RepID=UPI0035A62DBF
MMTEQPVHATTSPGASMDRRVARKATPWWRRRTVLISISVVIVALMLWRFLPASGSTDIELADVEIGTVIRAPFADYLPVRATVAPRVTTLVGVLSGGRSRRYWCRTVRWWPPVSQLLALPIRRSSSMF